MNPATLNTNPHPTTQATKRRIYNELRACGVTGWGMRYSEIRYLPRVLHHDEHIMAAIYGTHNGSRAIMVATDRRVIHIDKKPLFINIDELTYDIVGGVTYGQAGYQVTVILHSKIGDFKFRSFNKVCAWRFKNYIDERCIEHLQGSFHAAPTQPVYGHPRVMY